MARAKWRGGWLLGGRAEGRRGPGGAGGAGGRARGLGAAGVGAFVGVTLGAAALLLLAPRPARAQAPRAAPPPAASELALDVGAQHTLDVPGLQRVKVGDPGVADVRTGEASRLTVKGVTPGRTTLTVWTGEARTTYDVVVR